MKRILVTGGAGFISSNMIRYLLERTTHEVVTMDALTYAGNLANLDGVMGHERLRFIKGAIREQPIERFVLISSSEVYGTAESEPMTEAHPLNPRSPYAGTKAGGDRLAYSYYFPYDMP